MALDGVGEALSDLDLTGYTQRNEAIVNIYSVGVKHVLIGINRASTSTYLGFCGAGFDHILIQSLDNDVLELCYDRSRKFAGSDVNFNIGVDAGKKRPTNYATALVHYSTTSKGTIVTGAESLVA